MNDQTAQMGFQVGQTALKHGQEYVEQNVRGYTTLYLQNLTRNRLIATLMSQLSSITSMSRTLMLSINCSWCCSLGDTSHGPESKQLDRMDKRAGFCLQEKI